jgi:carbon storage regulator
MPLVISRKKNEQIIIDGRITVTVLEIRGDNVKLDIAAPKEIRIDRAEIHERRKAEFEFGKETNA